MAQQQALSDAGNRRDRIHALHRLSAPAAVLSGWAVASYPGVFWKLTATPDIPLISPDDAMRLVGLRDLLAGQGWFDLVQYRLGLSGVEMHWSRLVDAPLAAIMLGLRPFLGPDAAESATIFLWPLLLLLPALAFTALAGRALAGTAGLWAATLLMAFVLGASGRFVPGQIDHHNVQIVLLVMAVSLAATALQRPHAALGTGAAIAASIAVGVELLPVHVLFFACAAVAWVLAGGKAGTVLHALCLGFAVTLAAVFAATAPASAWHGGYCDALSLDLLAPALTGALGLAAAASRLSAASAGARFAALVAAGAAAGAATLAVAAGTTPACLADPLAGIDPFLRSHWLDHVSEAEGWGPLLLRRPAAQVPILIAALAGLVSAALLFRRARDERWLWATLGGTMLLSLALAFWQHRTAMVLTPLAVLPVATLCCRLVQPAAGQSRPWPRLGAVALFFATVPMTWDVVFSALPRLPAAPPVTTAGPATEDSPAWLCYRTGAMAPLAKLPPGLVSASSNLGAHILLAGPQRVLSAPYHRNTDGMIAQLRIALADDAQAETQLRQLGVDYVVACSHDREYAGFDGFGRRLAQGIAPAFLEPLAATPDGITIYRLTGP